MPEPTPELSLSGVSPERAPALEGSPFSSFRDAVLVSQEAWSNLKRPARKEFTQAIDMPPLVRRQLFSLAVDNLPSYIPQSVREQIKQNHPEPIIGVSFLGDHRLMATNPAVETLAYLPKSIPEEQADTWDRGITLLDELAVDTLALDILKTIAEKPVPHASGSRGVLAEIAARKPFAAERWLRPIAQALVKTASQRNYKTAITHAERAFGGKAPYETFRQTLVTTLLTGERTAIDRFLQQYGFANLDSYALAVGARGAYAGNVIGPVLEQVQNKGGVLARIGHSVFSLGIHSGRFQGVINIPLAPYALNAVDKSILLGIGQVIRSAAERPEVAAVGVGLSAMSGLLAVAPSLALPKVLIHEFAHYLSTDLTHQGLRPVVRSRREETGSAS